MGFVTYTGRTRSPAVSVHSLDRHAVTEAPGLPPRQPRRALGAGVRVPPQGSERFVPSGSGRAEIIGGCGSRGWGGFPRILDRARSAAEQGAGRRAGAGRAAAEAGREGPGADGGRVSGGSSGTGAARWPPGSRPRFPPSGGRSETASVNALPQPFLGRAGLRRRRLGRRGTQRDEPISCQASGEATRGGERHTKSAVSGGGGERGRRIRDGNSRPRPLAPPPPPPPPGLGPRPPRQCGRAPTPRASGYGSLRPSARPAPSREAWPPPGKGAPPRSRSREGSRSAAAEPGNLRAGKSLRRLRGAARRGAARPAPGVRGHRR
ncbi:collagen alpha-1(I) chain-like [Vulpes lagopus]|uniref:collagen alpha-1(I) chain-like n=1 Tax=Vulpes lagopus TaxID=494514 RepID=UPI001BCA14AF|nr:collagen alpha-1(I) chain-like [Vulpes lagopus]